MTAVKKVSEAEPSYHYKDGIRGALRLTQSTVAHPVRSYFDGWRGTTRIMRYQGTCDGCGRRLWSFDDGENDPRGALGDHACHDLGGDGDPERIVACAMCANEYEPYARIMRNAGKPID